MNDPLDAAWDIFCAVLDDIGVKEPLEVEGAKDAARALALAVHDASCWYCNGETNCSVRARVAALGG